MSKVINYIKNHDKIFIFIAIVIALIGIAMNLLVPFDVSDEMWNFQNTYKIYNGFQIYKEANVITTPLFFYIGVSFFKILGANIFVFRIYSIFIMSILYFFTYCICRNLKINKTLSGIITFTLLLINNFVLNISGANYNQLALSFVLIGLNHSIKNKDKKTKDLLFQGFIMAIIFLTKQNIGIYYILSTIVFDFIKNKKKAIKIILVKLGVFISLIFSFIVTLILKGDFYNFVNLAFLGIKDFGVSNILINKVSITIVILIIVIEISMAIILLKNGKINENEKENITELLIFSLFQMITIYPIMNDVHVMIGIYISCIMIVYCIIWIMLKNLINNKKILKIILASFIIILFFISFCNLIFFEKNIKKEENLHEYSNPFFGIIIEPSNWDIIKKVTEYINQNNRNVIDLSSDAAFYMVPLKRSNGLMDLALIGNIGKDGENVIINKINNLENTEILLSKEKKCWQESDKIRTYIKMNLEKIGEIEEYEIFYKK